MLPKRNGEPRAAGPKTNTVAEMPRLGQGDSFARENNLAYVSTAPGADWG
jgi:hypothetical protein